MKVSENERERKKIENNNQKAKHNAIEEISNQQCKIIMAKARQEIMAISGESGQRRKSMK